jgi:hypothetical protein
MTSHADVLAARERWRAKAGAAERDSARGSDGAAAWASHGGRKAGGAGGGGGRPLACGGQFASRRGPALACAWLALRHAAQVMRGA